MSALRDTALPVASLRLLLDVRRSGQISSDKTTIGYFYCAGFWYCFLKADARHCTGSLCMEFSREVGVGALPTVIFLSEGTDCRYWTSTRKRGGSFLCLRGLMR